MQRLVEKKCLCGKILRWHSDGYAGCRECECGYSAEFGVSANEVSKELLEGNVKVIDVTERSTKGFEDSILRTEEDIEKFNINEGMLAHKKWFSRIVRDRCTCGKTLTWHRKTGLGVCTECNTVYNAEDTLSVEEVNDLLRDNNVRVIDVIRDTFAKYEGNLK